MSDVFISYASADRDKASVLADLLLARGWSVWWDRTIPPGRHFDSVIEEALDDARCVVVLWSKASVVSTWVKSEAADAMSRGILVPALIEDVKIPLEFRRLQAADLTHSKLDRADDELARLLQAMSAICAPSVEPPAPGAGHPSVERRRSPSLALIVVSALAVVGAGAGAYALYAEHAKTATLKQELAAQAARERDRIVAEQAAARERDRIASENERTQERERIAREKAAAQERDRLARERAAAVEREKATTQERERLAREAAEAEARERQARVKADAEERARQAAANTAKPEPEASVKIIAATCANVGDGKFEILARGSARGPVGAYFNAGPDTMNRPGQTRCSGWGRPPPRPVPSIQEACLRAPAQSEAIDWKSASYYQTFDGKAPPVRKLIARVYQLDADGKSNYRPIAQVDVPVTCP